MKVYLVPQNQKILMFKENQIHNDENGMHYYIPNNWGYGENIYFTNYTIADIEHVVDVDKTQFYLTEEVVEHIHNIEWADKLYRTNLGEYILTLPDPQLPITQVKIMSKDEVNKLFENLKYNYEVQ